MKHFLFSLCFLLLFHIALTAQTTWKSPGYKPAPYRKVMVLARVTDATARKQLEDFTVKLLNDKGIVAISAYSNIKQTHVASREAFLAIADSLEVDALLVYSVNGTQKRVETTSTVSVGVGVGMYGGYAGASVPISANSQIVVDVKMSADFYNRASTDEQWASQLSGTVEKGTDKLAYTFARTTVKAMLKDGLFIRK